MTRLTPRHNPRPQGDEDGPPDPLQVARQVEANVARYAKERVRIAGRRHLSVFRLIEVRVDPGSDPLDGVDTQCLGRAWAAHPAGAHVYRSPHVLRHNIVSVLLEGEVTPDAVDWPQTETKASLFPWEYELVLRPAAPVHLVAATIDGRRVQIGRTGSVGPQTGDWWHSDCEEAFRRRKKARGNPQRRAKRAR